MFPVLTRIFWLLVQPSVAVLSACCWRWLLSFRARRGWCRTFLAARHPHAVRRPGFTTFGYLLITPLENRFVRPAEPARIDGIVVLGGGMDGEVNTVRHGWELNRSGDRYVETLRLALAPSRGEDA